MCTLKHRIDPVHVICNEWTAARQTEHVKKVLKLWVPPFVFNISSCTCTHRAPDYRNFPCGEDTKMSFARWHFTQANFDCINRMSTNMNTIDSHYYMTVSPARDGVPLGGKVLLILRRIPLALSGTRCVSKLYCSYCKLVSRVHRHPWIIQYLN